MSDNPFGFLLEDLLGEATFAELDKLEDFKRRMTDSSNAMQRRVAVLMREAEVAGASDRVLWLLICSPISALISASLLNLMEHYHAQDKSRPTMIEVGAALSTVCSVAVRRGLSHVASGLRKGEPLPEDIGLLNADDGKKVSVEQFRRVMLNAGLPIGPEDTDETEFVFLNRLGTALFGETLGRSPVQVGVAKMPDGTNIDLDRAAHGIEITDDPKVMARRLAIALQEIARAVSGVYIANGKVEDGLNVITHAVAMVTAYCATLSIPVIRDNEEDGSTMTRVEAARSYMRTVMESADEAVTRALGELDRQEAIKNFPDAPPVGEA